MYQSQEKKNYVKIKEQNNVLLSIETQCIRVTYLKDG